jgi:RHS repeat-associated protein
LVAALDRIHAYAFDAAGNLIEAKDPLGNTIRYAWDVRDHLARVIKGEEEVHLVHSFDGRLLSVKDGEDRTLLYDYDEEGRLVSILDGNGNETALDYDGSQGCGSCGIDGAAAAPSRITYPTFERGFRYDRRGRKTAERDILSDTEALYTAYAYDATGNLTKITDAEGRSTQYHYDALGRLLRVEDAAGGITSYTYDARDNLLSLTDAKGQTTRFVYDLNNRLVEEIRPGGQKLRYAYDAAGGLVERIDPKNQRTRYDYDDAGRLEKIHYFGENAGPSPLKTVRFSYDGAGRLAGYDDGESSATYTYDAAGRKLEEALSLQGFTVSQAYTYYKNGLKQSYTGPDGVTQGYLYDQTNQLAGVVIPGAGMFTVNEFTWNRPSRATVPGGTVKTQSYDPLMRLEAMEVKDPAGNTRLERSYGFDRVGNVKEKHTEHGDYAYTYDDLYRLTEALNPRPVKEEAFEYDAVGNRKRSNATDGEWRYDTNNALTGFDDVSYEYDANGNMVRKLAGGLVTSYVYNLEDRLSEVWAGEPETGRQIASYGYDPFGRRLWKEVAGKKTWFVYSDEGLVAELDGSGREIRSFGWKPGGIWGTDPLYLKEAGHYYWYHNDHLGTPQMLTASSGAVVWEAKYESFGRAMVAGGARVKNPLRFPGQYEDEETGLHYNWMRYYDPATGRYLRGDPIGLEGGVNVYAYALNSPLNLIDPDGEIAFVPVLALVMRGASIALTAYDLYQTAMIVMDPCSSAGDIGMAVAGLGIPGGGGVKKLGRAAKKLPRYQGPKPKYHVNPQHVPGRGLKPGKTPLPNDAESVFKNAVPNDPKNPTAWFGKNADGQIYRFSAGNDGTAHFSGIHGVGDGTRNLTDYAIQRLGGL